MTHDRSSVIVVGVDDSEASVAALVFAMGEAVRRRSAVEAVTAWYFDNPSTARERRGARDGRHSDIEGSESGGKRQCASRERVLCHHFSPVSPMSLGVECHGAVNR